MFAYTMLQEARGVARITWLICIFRADHRVVYKECVQTINLFLVLPDNNQLQKKAKWLGHVHPRYLLQICTMSYELQKTD